VELISHEEIDKNRLQKHAAEMVQETAFFYENLVSADVEEDIDEIRIQHCFETYAKAAQANGEALAEIDRLNRATAIKQKPSRSPSPASIAYPGTPVRLPRVLMDTSIASQ
jgi:hypothetical protein